MMPWSGVFDGHVDTLLAVKSLSDFIDGNSTTQLDLPRARAGGVSGLVTAICAEAAADPHEALTRGLEFWAGARKAAEGIELHLGLEGCEPIAAGWLTDEAVSSFSVATLTWNGMNSLGGGIGTDSGLTPVGRRLAVKLHQAGILVDISHLCDRARRDALGLGIPVVASHCNCRSLCDTPRNLPDDDIREIAALGGLVGITFVPAFLGPDAGIDMVVDHVEHAASVAGICHIGFGSDFDGVSDLPLGIRGCSNWPDVFESLEKRGWRQGELELLASGNWKKQLARGGALK
jgi:membrane dipeptidase